MVMLLTGPPVCNYHFQGLHDLRECAVRRDILFGLIILFVCLSFSVVAKADRRVALVIGNSAYKHAGELANPRNDAADISAALKKL